MLPPSQRMATAFASRGWTVRGIVANTAAFFGVLFGSSNRSSNEGSDRLRQGGAAAGSGQAEQAQPPQGGRVVVNGMAVGSPHSEQQQRQRQAQQRPEEEASVHLFPGNLFAVQLGSRSSRSRSR
jgi:hypothetical protein